MWGTGSAVCSPTLLLCNSWPLALPHVFARELLAEKSTALEQLAARNQALDAAQLQIRELTTASHDRLQLAQDKAQVGSVGGWTTVQRMPK